MGDVDVGLVALKEWASGAFSAYICCLDGGFKLDWTNSEEIIFLMDIMDRDCNILNPACEVV